MAVSAPDSTRLANKGRSRCVLREWASSGAMVSAGIRIIPARLLPAHLRRAEMARAAAQERDRDSADRAAQAGAEASPVDVAADSAVLAAGLADAVAVDSAVAIAVAAVAGAADSVKEKRASETGDLLDEPIAFAARSMCS